MFRLIKRYFANRRAYRELVEQLDKDTELARCTGWMRPGQLERERELVTKYTKVPWRTPMRVLMPSKNRFVH